MEFSKDSIEEHYSIQITISAGDNKLVIKRTAARN